MKKLLVLLLVSGILMLTGCSNEAKVPEITATPEATVEPVVTPEVTPEVTTTPEVTLDMTESTVLCPVGVDENISCEELVPGYEPWTAGYDNWFEGDTENFEQCNAWAEGKTGPDYTHICYEVKNNGGGLWGSALGIVPINQ